MADEDSNSWVFGLIFIFCGICSVMSMGVWSANHPHVPLTKGQEQCGDPPNIDLDGVASMSDLMKLEVLTVVYNCPEGQQMSGPAKRTCGEEGKWMPGEEERTSCHVNE
eukprot:TRINITY_DN7599_c0_g1_i1.p1 TRINITY_DN7599_c0_g1~~TRINITY_DN7599_c0_g1_i1.p1  ORF type:complete len:109 (+),score=28.69 TRINITY_DN7599_c0_g1_i1:33-359(+)